MTAVAERQGHDFQPYPNKAVGIKYWCRACKKTFVDDDARILALDEVCPGYKQMPVDIPLINIR